MNLLSSVAVTLGLSASAYSQAPNVAIVAAASVDPSDCRFSDVASYLMATGSFSSVSIIDCATSTPAASDLAPFDALLTWSAADYADGTQLGNVMADYVDAGGGVVAAVYASTTTLTARQLLGRWATGGYEVIMAGQGQQFSGASLGTILDPTHPAVQGVSDLTADLAFRPLQGTQLVQGSVVAEWDDGSILVAAGTMPGRIDLGLYPPSDNCVDFFWDFSGDGDTLIANSLLAVAGTPSLGIGTAYCTGAMNSTGTSGQLRAVGSAVAASNNVTLLGSDLPLFSFSFFIVSQSQGFTANPGGSSGNLCLSGPIGRYVAPGQVQQANVNGNTTLAIDLTLTPTPAGGLVTVVAGQVWNFQAWYRDSSPSGGTSNFTNGYSISFN